MAFHIDALIIDGCQVGPATPGGSRGREVKSRGTPTSFLPLRPAAATLVYPPNPDPWARQSRHLRMNKVISKGETQLPHRDMPWGACVAQSVKRPTSAQVMSSRFVRSSHASGSVLTAQSLEPVSDSVSPSLSDPPLFMLCLSLSLNNK